MNAKTVLTKWEIRTYDVWGNEEEGYTVNDSFMINHAYPIRCKIETFNPGTPQEFISAYPSDIQIKHALGVSGSIETEGDDLNIYVNSSDDNYPLGELFCVSHDSLSPIRRK